MYTNIIFTILKIISFPFRLLIVPVYLVCFSLKKYFDSRKEIRYKNGKIICVGNCNIGGSGKTVVVKKLAEELLNRKKNVVILSRGYKRKNGKKTVILSNQTKKDQLQVTICGDEPFMLYSELKIPVVVTKKKSHGINTAIQIFKPQIIISDDGYQNFSFHKDINILVINMLTISKYDTIFPLGKLREPIRNGISRADYVILNHTKFAEPKKIFYIKNMIQQYNPNSKIISTFYEIKKVVNFITQQEYSLQEFITKISDQIVMVTGIAEPISAKIMLEHEHIKIKKFLSYPDHYWFSQKELTKWYKFNLPIIVTQKDAVRLIPLKIYTETKYFEKIYYLDIELIIDEGKSLWDNMINSL